MNLSDIPNLDNPVLAQNKNPGLNFIQMIAQDWAMPELQLQHQVTKEPAPVISPGSTDSRVLKPPPKAPPLKPQQA